MKKIISQYSMSSGYKLSNGKDIATLFVAGSSPGVTTGYKLTNGIDDIATLFVAGSSPGVITGYKLSNGNDIATLFKPVSSLSPLDVSGCCLWMDAADNTTVSLSSTKVNKWTDKSINKYTMNQITSAKQPTYNTTTNLLNGLSTLTFTSASLQYLYGDTSANSFKVGTNCYSLFAVCKNTGGLGHVFTKSYFGAGAGRIGLGKDSNLYSCFVCHDGASGNLPTSISDTNINYRILEMVINRSSGNDYVYENGSTTPKVSFTYTSDITTNLTNTYEMLIGAYGNTGTPGSIPAPGYYLSGEIAEIVSFANPSDMTVATRQWVEGYLAWKWGLQGNLPSGHTYKTSGPAALPP